MTEAFVHSGRFSVSSCDAGGALEPAIGYWEIIVAALNIGGSF
ncbi:hypothetical protein [Thiocapsa bogorovii]|nr:hypothetical protein [Thiocapsa bogorovii]